MVNKDFQNSLDLLVISVKASMPSHLVLNITSAAEVKQTNMILKVL